MSVLGDVAFFDIHALDGIIFDDYKKKVVVYSCAGTPHKVFCERKNISSGVYTYFVLDYSQLLSVKVEVNNKVSYESKTSATNVLGRSVVGGLIGGEAGAIIGGTTANRQTETQAKHLPEKIRFVLLTSDPSHRVIEYMILRPFSAPEGVATADKLIGSVSKNNFPPMYVIDSRLVNRTGGSTVDIEIGRQKTQPEERSDRVSDNINKEIGQQGFVDANMYTAKTHLIDYAQRIEAIILENSKNVTSAKSDISLGTSSKSVVDQLRDLKALLAEGLLSEDEYEEKRKKLVDRL